MNPGIFNVGRTGGDAQLRYRVRLVQGQLVQKYGPARLDGCDLRTGLGTLQPPGLADGVAASVANKVVDPLAGHDSRPPQRWSRMPAPLRARSAGCPSSTRLSPPTVATGQAVSITIAGGS